MKDRSPSQTENAATESIEALKDRLRAEDRPIVDPGLYDAHGTKFEPESHVADQDGNSKMNKGGTFRRRPQKPIDTVILDDLPLDWGGMPPGSTD